MFLILFNLIFSLPWEAVIWIFIQIAGIHAKIGSVVGHHRVITVIVAVFVLVAGLSSQRAHAGMDKFVALGTGSTSGVFYAVGQGICDLVNKRRAKDLVRCIGYSTGGSVFNIQALISRELDMGMTSSDLAYQSYKGEAEFAVVGAAKNLRTVASFYDCPSSCNWNKERVDLKEDLAHLFGYVKRRICGIASAWFPLSFV